MSMPDFYKTYFSDMTVFEQPIMANGDVSPNVERVFEMIHINDFTQEEIKKETQRYSSTIPSLHKHI